MRWLVKVTLLSVTLVACASTPRVRSIGNCQPDPDENKFKCTSADGVAGDLLWNQSRGLLTCFRNDELPGYLEGCK